MILYGVFLQLGFKEYSYTKICWQLHTQHLALFYYKSALFISAAAFSVSRILL